jgi:hypothetical protein
VFGDFFVIPPSLLHLSVLLFLSNAAFSQDNRPLGDVAREAQAMKSSSPKSTKVLTNDDISTRKDQNQAGKLSQDKQAFCDELRLRKDPAAEQGCTLLTLDMGPEYEALTAREVELSKSLCNSNGGTHLPGSIPKDPALAAQYRELAALSSKFMEMMQTEMKSFSDAEGAVNAVRQEKSREQSRVLPGGRNSATQLASPEEKQRLLEIEDKYKSRIQEKEEAAHQIKLRGLRLLVDSARMENVCGRH